jgi:DNA-binding MarR family transcriptional regulator
MLIFCMPPKPRPVIERLNENIDKSGGPDACWLWGGCLFTTGYGVIRIAGKNVKTHRAMYEHSVGPIPEGLALRHLCESRYAPGDLTCRRCCNPTHLAPGTCAENTADMLAAGRHSRVGAPPKISDEVAQQIVELYEKGGVRQIDLARQFGVSQPLVSMLLNGHLRENALGAREAKNRNIKLSDENVRLILEKYATGAHKQTDLADEFGVSQAHISRLVRRA